MSQLIEAYIDRLLHDPNALPPQGMDAETAAFTRALVAAQHKPSASQRVRMWQRSLDAAKTANHAHSQTTVFQPSSNGHQVHTSPISGEDMMTAISIPFVRKQERRSSTRFVGILPLAAAITLVMLGIALLSSIPAATPSLNGPQGNNTQGSSLGAESSTATTVPSSTPIPVSTDVPGRSFTSVEYTIQPGDTLLSILVQFGFTDVSVLPTLEALNPTFETDGLPAPGSTIVVPLPSPSAIATPALTATPFPASALPISSTPIPGPFATSDASQPAPVLFPSRIEGYVVQSGETMLDILTRFDLTLQTLAELNPQIDSSGCDFSRLSGGVNCAFNRLTAGDQINVPMFDVALIEAVGTALPPTMVPPEDTAMPAPSIVGMTATASPFPTAVPR